MDGDYSCRRWVVLLDLSCGFDGRLCKKEPRTPLGHASRGSESPPTARSETNRSGPANGLLLTDSATAPVVKRTDAGRHR